MKRIETRKIIWLDELNDEKILTFKHSRNDLNFQPITLKSNQKMILLLKYQRSIYISSAMSL